MIRKLGIALTGVLLCLCISGCSADQKSVTELKRPGIGEEASVHNLVAVVDGTKYEVNIPVEPQKIDEEELPKYFELGFEYVCEKMLGNNISFDQITSDMDFVQTIPKYGMKVAYFVDNYEVINSFGGVNREAVKEFGADCVIKIRLSYEAFFQEYEVPVKVVEKEYSEAELFEQELFLEIDKQNDKEVVILPKEVQGKGVTFVTPGQAKYTFVLLLVLCVFTFLYYKKFVEPKQKKEKQETSLKLDYSEIVSKLTLLMGAGMSGANAIIKIADDCEGQKNSYAYEKIVILANRIKSGVPEADAYAMFGKETRLHSYLKLSNLLTQNLKKGSEGFMETLKTETSEAFVERKNIAKIKGEQAGTKLLLPMGMMLVVVLVMIMVPAFMSF